MQCHWRSCIAYKRQTNGWEFEVEMWGVFIVADWACKWEGMRTGGRGTWRCEAAVGWEICVYDLGGKLVWVHTWCGPKTHNSSYPSSQGAWVPWSLPTHFLTFVVAYMTLVFKFHRSRCITPNLVLRFHIYSLVLQVWCLYISSYFNSIIFWSMGITLASVCIIFSTNEYLIFI